MNVPLAPDHINILEWKTGCGEKTEKKRQIYIKIERQYFKIILNFHNIIVFTVLLLLTLLFCFTF